MKADIGMPSAEAKPGKMIRRSLWRDVRRVCLAIALVACMPTSIESSRWWNSPQFVSALDLTDAQRAAIERIYQDTLPERMTRAAKADASHETLNRLMDSNATDTAVEAAASASADADAARHRGRTLMLYRMMRVLTLQQRQRLALLANRRARQSPAGR